MSDPTDDEIRATTERALMSLRAAADRALDHGNRALGRDVAREYRKLLVEAADTRSPQLARIAAAMASDGERIRQVLGTAGWDEPDNSKPTHVPPAIASGPRDESDETPLTDAELRSLLEDAEDEVASDEWLERALKEIAARVMAGVWPPDVKGDEEPAAMAILRKHRDGKA